MSDNGRYGSTTYENRTRNRERGSRYGGGRNESIFGDWRSSGDRESRRDHGDSRSNDSGGWAGDQRTSAYESRGRQSRESGMDRGGMGREQGYGADDYREGFAIDETSDLIASNKVEGTPVYGRDGERLGSIYNFMVDKLSGKVKYAVMSYGGFLGMGQHYFPLPWDILDYDVREGGYHVNMTERDLEKAPSFNRDNEPRFNSDYDRHVSRYYGTR